MLLSRNSEEGRKNDAGTNLSASISQVPYQKKKKKAYQMKTWGITNDSRYSTESNQAKGHRRKKKPYSQCCCLTWQVWWNVSAEKIFFEVPYRRRTLANPLWHTREGHEKTCKAIPITCLKLFYQCRPSHTFPFINVLRTTWGRVRDTHAVCDAMMRIDKKKKKKRQHCDVLYRSIPKWQPMYKFLNFTSTVLEQFFYSLFV